MGNYDELIKYWQDEIAIINEEMSKTEDEEKLQALRKKKGVALMKK
jgi:hypothetical protein